MGLLTTSFPSRSIRSVACAIPSVSGKNGRDELGWKGSTPKPLERSLITLKALTYRPTGGIVAAPTTSLPEQIGGERNWDCRYCWLRDATFTLLALMNAGYFEEAGAWRKWLLRTAAGSADQVQIMYGIRGERSMRLDIDKAGG